MNSFLFIFIAAICNSMMDNVGHHWYKSIFKRLDVKFFNPNVSWEYAKQIYGYKVDFWHLCKSSMIIFLCLAIIYYKPLFGGLIDFILMGLVWNGTFNLFYNHILNEAQSNS